MMKIAKGTKTERVTISWVIFICIRVSDWLPKRLAGIMMLYSKKAIIQLVRMARKTGASALFFKW